MKAPTPEQKAVLKPLRHEARYTKDLNRLAELVRHPEHYMRTGAAGNKNLTPELMRVIAQDKPGPTRAELVREEIPRTESVQAAVDRVLQEETAEEFNALFAKAINPDTPAEELVELTKHHSPAIAWNAIRSLPLNVAEPIMLDHKASQVRQQLADVTADPKILRKLAQDHSIDVRFAVAGNRRTPDDALQTLVSALKPGDVGTAEIAAMIRRNWNASRQTHALMARKLIPETPEGAVESLLAVGPRDL